GGPRQNLQYRRPARRNHFRRDIWIMSAGQTAGRRRTLSEFAALAGAKKSATRTRGRRIAIAVCRLHPGSRPVDPGGEHLPKKMGNLMVDSGHDFDTRYCVGKKLCRLDRPLV